MLPNIDRWEFIVLDGHIILDGRSGVLELFALVSAALSITVNQNRYTEVNVLLMIAAAFLFLVMTLFLIIKGETVRLCGALMYTAVFGFILIASSYAIGGLLALIVCYLFLVITLKVRIIPSDDAGKR